MADYSFLTTWQLDCRREPVWDAIYAQERWPEWWRGVEMATPLTAGDGDGIGSTWKMIWRSLLPYRLCFDVTATRVERPHLLEGHAVGELTGVGRWRFGERNGVTTVRYEWNVATSKTWMNLVAPVARPVFEWNHDWVMARGGEGIARLLGCHLLAGH